MTDHDEDLHDAIWRAPVEDIDPPHPKSRALRSVGVAVASLFIPGLGQVLNGSLLKAGLIFVFWVAAWIFHIKPVWIFLTLYAGIEAFLTARSKTRPP